MVESSRSRFGLHLPPPSGVVAVYALSVILAALLMVGQQWLAASVALIVASASLVARATVRLTSGAGLVARRVAVAAVLVFCVVSSVTERLAESLGQERLLLACAAAALAVTADLLRLQRRAKAGGSVETDWLGRGGLVRASTSGAVATLLDFALVATSVQVLGMSPPVATFLGCLFGGFINFNVNRYWAFLGDGHYVSQAWRYAVISGSSAVLNAALVGAGLLGAAAVQSGGVPYPAVWWLARGLVFVGFNHPMNRDYVFSGAAI